MITSAIQNLNLLPEPDPGELDQLKERIVELDDFCRQSFGKHMVYAFLCGVALNRAKQIVPHGNFARWHQAELPQLSRATLHRYMIFAGGLLARFPALQGLNAAPPLACGDLTGTESQQLLDAVHEAADGKTITDFYRDLGVIRPSRSRAGPRTYCAARAARDCFYRAWPSARRAPLAAGKNSGCLANRPRRQQPRARHADGQRHRPQTAAHLNPVRPLAKTSAGGLPRRPDSTLLG